MMLGSKSNIIKSNTIILLINTLELNRIHNHAKMALENP